MTAWRVPLGEGEVAVNVPAGWAAELAAPPEHPVLADLDSAIAVGRGSVRTTGSSRP